jgi:ABC-type branched-subunit amino acid transport system ATPase component
VSILQVSDVKKAYGGIQALTGCTMSFEEGAINGLIGPNGSGKTTLFNVISGESPSAGRTSLTPGRTRCSSWDSGGLSRSPAYSRG